MGLATRVTMRVVVTIPLTVTLSLASEPEPPPLPRYPDWYAPLERYVSYGVDQVERAVEGIEQLER
jgi:hypothetical protein